MADDDSADDVYGGVLGAFRYASGSTGSRLAKIYVWLGGVLGGIVVLLFALALITLLGNTASVGGGTFTFSRAFFVLLMLFVLGPLIAPVLLIARRHRRTGSDPRYDRRVAITGYGFIVAVYVGLIVSTPASQQGDPGGPLGVVVAFLYDLPRVAGIVPPLLAITLLTLVHWHATRAAEA